MPTVGAKTFPPGNGVPLFGCAELLQDDATVDHLTLTQKAATTGNVLRARLDGGGRDLFIVGPTGSIDLFRVKTAAKTTNYTVVVADSGTFFDNTGAAGSVTFTLPAVAVAAGCFFVFQAAVAAQNLVVAAPAGTLVTFNNAAAASITCSTAGRIIGAAIMVYCDGAKYHALDLPSIGTIATAGISDFTVA